MQRMTNDEILTNIAFRVLSALEGDGTETMYHIVGVIEGYAMANGWRMQDVTDEVECLINSINVLGHGRSARFDGERFKVERIPNA